MSESREDWERGCRGIWREGYPVFQGHLLDEVGVDRELRLFAGWAWPAVPA